MLLLERGLYFKQLRNRYASHIGGIMSKDHRPRFMFIKEKNCYML